MLRRACQGLLRFASATGELADACVAYGEIPSQLLDTPVALGHRRVWSAVRRGGPPPPKRRERGGVGGVFPFRGMGQGLPREADLRRRLRAAPAPVDTDGDGIPVIFETVDRLGSGRAERLPAKP